MERELRRLTPALRKLKRDEPVIKRKHDGDAVSLGGGRSTDAATAGDGRGRSSATGPHRRRRAGLWEAVEGSPVVGGGGGCEAALWGLAAVS